MKRLVLACSTALLLLSAQPSAAAQDADGELLDRIVAVVEDDAVMLSELRQRMRVIRRQFADRAAELPPADTLARQVLERIVIEQLQLQMAERRGIRIDDSSLNGAMRKLASSNNMSLGEFRERLLSEHIDYRGFREQIRHEMVIERLRRQVIDSQVQVTDKEIQDMLARQAGAIDSDVELRVNHILVAVPEDAGPEELRSAREQARGLRQRALAGEDFVKLAASESDGQNALEGGDLGWRRLSELPSLFARPVAGMDTGEISEVVRSPSGFHIIRLAERRGGDQAMVDQARARHILIKPNAVLNNEQARQRLATLRERIRTGADFTTLAKANSDDKASAVDGGDLGWMGSGDVVPRFEEVMNSLEVGQLSEPFRTRYGWHVVEVTDRRRHDSTDELLRQRAREVLRKRKTEDETEQWLRRLRDESYVEFRLDGEERG